MSLGHYLIFRTGMFSSITSVSGMCALISHVNHFLFFVTLAANLLSGLVKSNCACISGTSLVVRVTELNTVTNVS